jgi:hypothetical protein
VPATPTDPAPPRPVATPPKRSIVPLLLMGLVAAGLIAVGARQLLAPDTGEAADPAKAAGSLAAAVEARDGAAICQLLTDDAAGEIARAGNSSCRESLRVLFARLDDAAVGSVEVLEVVRKGTTAGVSFRWELGTGELRLELDDGEWRVDGIDALDPSGGAAIGAGPTGSAEACATTLRTVETAVEAFRAVTGADPPDGQALVDADLLRELPADVEVQPGGEVVPAGSCA